MHDKEFLEKIKEIRNLKMTKEEWYHLNDETRFEILEKLRDINKYNKSYIEKNISKNLNELDPYNEENWED